MHTWARRARSRADERQFVTGFNKLPESVRRVFPTPPRGLRAECHRAANVRDTSRVFSRRNDETCKKTWGTAPSPPPSFLFFSFFFSFLTYRAWNFICNSAGREAPNPTSGLSPGEKNGRLPRITSTVTTDVTFSRDKRNGRLSRITSTSVISYNDYRSA